MKRTASEFMMQSIVLLATLFAAACGEDAIPANKCGNGVADGTEQCDGVDMRGASCATLGLGYTGGTLRCSATCVLERAGCTANAACGNGALDVGEDCDGTNLDGNDCTSIAGGFTGGTLACNDNCSFDASACEVLTTCPNGTVDVGEDCDGSELDGNDCTSIGGGFTGGTLACDSDCSFDTTACEISTTCPNGTLDVGEDCDGDDLDGNDCTTVPGGFVTGTLACTGACAFNTTACATASQLLADVLAAADASGLSLPVQSVYVTYVKPLVGSDPAGFFVQAAALGPALFVAIDPTTLTPSPTRGDLLSFTVTDLTTVGDLRQATGIAGLSVQSSGQPVANLVQDVGAATDLVSGLDDYAAELITITDAVIADPFASAGAGHQSAQIDTAGVTGSNNLKLRLPTALNDVLQLVQGCTVTIQRTPLWRYQAQAQVSAWTLEDLPSVACPAPVVLGATPTNVTTVMVTLSRNVLASSVVADGSQFSFDNGLVATAAVVSGATVTLSTSAQSSGQPYVLTVANTVTDLLGTGVSSTANTTQFTGFVVPAVVRINELNANVTGGCDLIELRVIAGGSLNGYRLTERTGATTSNELAFTFPDLVLQTNDLVIVHMNATNLGGGTCNVNGATQETTGPAQQPTASFAGNFDTAYDFWSADAGLTSTDNVFTLVNVTGDLLDVVFVANQATGTAAAATETAAATAATADQWHMVAGGIPVGGFVDDNFRAHAALDLDGTGNAATGTTIQRLDDTDDNDKDDWNNGTTTVQPQTWGLRNAGQSAL